MARGRLWYGFAAMSAVFLAGVLYAQQYPLMDMIANRVIQKYQQASCEDLWKRKGQPKSEEEQRFVQLLRDDPQAQATFINQVAAPIANKMFACGLIP